MSEPMPNINELPYAPWLEGALSELVNFPVKGICMFATTEDGSIYSNYHEISVMDKLTISGLIQMDATNDALIANGQIKPVGEDE